MWLIHIAHRAMAVGAGILLAGPAFAGAPFLLDDSGTPDKGHFEINIASQYQQNSSGWAATLPHVEVNYGLTDKLQVTVFTPVQAVHTYGSPIRVGLGDISATLKYRLVEADDWGWKPGVAVAPQIITPSGNPRLGLGTGHTAYFLPVWLSKEFDQWTVFGGGGYAINPGAGRRNFWLGGVGLTRELNPTWTVGVELYHITSTAAGLNDSTGFTLGAVYNISETHHILFSAGRNLIHANQNNTLSTFVGYQLTF